MSERIADVDLIDELQRLAEELGRTPTAREMTDRGRHSHTTYQLQFGSWNEAIEAAGLEPNPRGPSSTSEEKLLNELRRLADELGRTPTIRDMRECGAYSPNTYQKSFGTWNAAVEKAGFEPDPRGRPSGFSPGCTSLDAPLDVLQSLAVELERPPQPEDVDTHTEYDSADYLERWDSWWVACSVAGVTQADLEGVFDATADADAEGGES